MRKSNLAILRLAPFGAQHETPIFYTKGLKVAKISTVGTDGQHLKLRLTNQRNNSYVNAIWWRHGSWEDTLKEGQTIDIAYVLSKENFQGFENLSLILEDIKIPVQ